VINNLALFNVAQKILMQKQDKYLILRTKSGKIDLPGGRINEDEDKSLLLTILTREINEELGSKIKYTIGAFAYQFRRYWNTEKGTERTFLTVFEGEYLGGEIVLSDEHTKYEWRTLDEIRNMEDYFMSQEEFEEMVNFICEKS
jgi:8-oxo-dGTP pyrophosphatase MutT (NUDIX family)